MSSDWCLALGMVGLLAVGLTVALLSAVVGAMWGYARDPERKRARR